MSNDTTSTATRYKYTNDLLAAVLVAATVAAVGASVYLTGEVPGKLATVFAVESLLAATWAFGRETLGAVAEAWPFGGNSGEQPVRVVKDETADDGGEA